MTKFSLQPAREDSQTPAAQSKDSRSLEGMVASQQAGDRSEPPEWKDPISPEIRARMNLKTRVIKALAYSLSGVAVIGIPIGMAVVNSLESEKSTPDSVQTKVDATLPQPETSHNTVQSTSEYSFKSTWEGFPHELPKPRALKDFLMANVVPIPSDMKREFNLRQPESSLFDLPLHILKKNDEESRSYVVFTLKDQEMMIERYKPYTNHANAFCISKASLESNNFHTIGVSPYLQKYKTLKFYLCPEDNQLIDTDKELQVAYTTYTSPLKNVTFIHMTKVSD